MKHGAAIFLQAVIVLIGLVGLAILLVEPHFEGRNSYATFFEIYFKDPFLAYAYIAAVPFFVGLYQAFTVLGYIRHGEAASPAVVKALRTIKLCAIAVIAFVAGGMIFIMLAESDDRAGGLAIGILIAFGSSMIAAAAAMFERIVHNELGARPSL